MRRVSVGSGGRSSFLLSAVWAVPILIEEPDGLQASWFSRHLQRFPKPCESGHVVRFSVVFAGGPSREGVRESNIRGSSGLRLVLLFVCPCRRLPRLGRGQGRQGSQTLQPKAHEKSPTKRDAWRWRACPKQSLKDVEAWTGACHASQALPPRTLPLRFPEHVSVHHF